MKMKQNENNIIKQNEIKTNECTELNVFAIKIN